MVEWGDEEQKEHPSSFSKLRLGESSISPESLDVCLYKFDEDTGQVRHDVFNRKPMSNKDLFIEVENNGVFYADLIAGNLIDIGFFTGDIQRVIEVAKVKTRAEEAEEQSEEESKADVYSDLEFFDESALQLKHAPNIRKGVDAPYHHIPQAMKNGKLTSGKVSSTGHHLYKENAYSGTLQCSITCLTPGHFGNYQESLSKISQLNISGENVLSKVRQHIESNAQNTKNVHKKNVILPNFYQVNDDSKPLAMINGSSIMGMLRNNVASLVSAPMQRVAEKTSSYRPNLTVADDKKEPWQKSKNAFAATVEDILFDHATGEPERITVKLYPLNSIKFPREDENGNRELLRSGERMRYLEGVDAKHHLKREFKGNKNFEPCGEVSLNGEPLINRERSIENSEYFEFYIEHDVIQQFKLTTKHLKDTKQGHLVSHHPHFFKAKKNVQKAILEGIEQQRNLQDWIPNNKGTLLIYVEASVDKKGKPYRIVSFGNHFRYYWLYKDSVRMLNSGLGEGVLRPELTLDANEAFKTNSLPEQLNLARSLFGDVEQDANGKTEEKKESNTFSRIAGRVNVNHALEYVHEQNVTKSIANSQICFAMPRAGAPRPNAEHNLIQYSDSPSMSTWGWVADDPDTVLAGRKFYRHQRNSANYKINPKAIEQTPNLAEVFAPILNYVSPKESQYRTSLRFKGLSPIELGILLIAIQPDRLLKDDIQNKLPTSIRDYFNKINRDQQSSGESPVFAHKLGYGKPLGLGSVGINIDSAKLLRTNIQKGAVLNLESVVNSDEEMDFTISAAIEYMDKSMLDEHGESCWDKVLLPWLILHNFQNAPQRLEYPSAKAKVKNKETNTIVKYHSNVRGNQIEQRRIVDSEKHLFVPKAKGEEPNHGLLKPHHKLKEALPEK